MAILDYSHAIILPMILIFSIPLTIFATITSILAFSILFIRVLVVYAELAIAVIPYYLLGPTSQKPTIPRIKSFVDTAVPASGLPRRRKRRTSTGSATSAGSLTPVPSTLSLNLSLPQSQFVGQARDFEGVGGWRFDGPSEDDSLWTNINSRLELPADHVRRHKRSLTSGSMPSERTHERRRREERSYSPETRMTVQTSPNTSRARTPPTTTTAATAAGGDGYFPVSGGSPKLKKSTASMTTNNSASSCSSKGSGVLSMKSRRD